MSALRSLLSVLRARWFWSLVGAVILSLLIWFFGDLLGFGETRPLETPVARLVGILVIAVLWGVWNLLAQARARRSNDQLVSALAEPAAKGEAGLGRTRGTRTALRRRPGAAQAQPRSARRAAGAGSTSCPGTP